LLLQLLDASRLALHNGLQLGNQGLLFGHQSPEALVLLDKFGVTPHEQRDYSTSRDFPQEPKSPLKNQGRCSSLGYWNGSLVTLRGRSPVNRY
jgi:hypothetical protein